MAILTDIQGHVKDEPHQYEIICKVCGERGTITISVDPQYAEPPKDIRLDAFPAKRGNFPS